MLYTTRALPQPNGRIKPPPGTPLDVTHTLNTVANYPGAPAASPLLGCWPVLDVRAPVTDLAASPDPLTVGSGTTWGAGGFGGPALSFTGTSFASHADVAALELGSHSFAAGCWMRNTGAVNASGSIFMGRYDTTNGGWCLFVYTDHKAYGLVDVSGFPSFQVGPSTTSVDDGLWHQVVLVRDNGAALLRLYVDGVQQATLSTSGIGGADVAGVPFALGAASNAGAATQGLVGLVDHAWLLYRILHVDEVWQLYNRPFDFLAPYPRGVPARAYQTEDDGLTYQSVSLW